MDESGSIPEDARPRARCPHFGACGGCATQDIPYPEQVERKAATLREVLGGAFGAALQPVTPSPSLWYYRNKMEFAFGIEGGALAVGLRRRGRFQSVVDIRECYIMSEAVAPVLAAAREWGAANGYPPYHLRRHEGLLRYVVMREGKRTGQRLVILVTAPPPDAEAFSRSLDALGERLRGHGVTSFLWSVTDRKADLAVGEVRRAVFGEPWFEEKLAGMTFRLSPHAFFQPNVTAVEEMVVRAGGMLGQGWEVMLDLYCGVGGLTLPLSGRAKRSIGVESDEAAVSDAVRNAGLNGVSSCQFVADDALSFLRRFSNYSFLGDRWAVVLDPPRAGMHPRMASQLLRVAPPVIVYVSCNPKMLAGDLAQLRRDYEVKEAWPYDFFPHTPHVEVLAWLARK